MLLGDYFTNIFKLAGIDTESDEAKALLSNTAVSGYDLPDAVINKVNGALLTVDSAKNNPDLKNYFTALALNGIDDEINATLPELGLSEEAQNKLKEVRSTYKRVTTLANLVKEAASNGKPADDSELKKQLDALNGEVAKLNGELKAAGEAKNLALADLQNQHANQLKDMSLNALLSGYDYAAPVSKEANLLTAKTLLNQALASKQLNVVRDEAGNLTLRTHENTEYYENNTPVSFKDYTERVLGEHKLLKVNEPNPTPAPGAPAPAATIVTPSNGMANSAADVAEQMLREAMGEAQ